MPDTTGYDPAHLIATHQMGVWRYLRVLGCEPALADDLTQETFLAVLKAPFRELSPSATASYLRTTAHNLFISYHRKAKRMTATADIEALDRQWAKWVADDSGEALLDALKDCLQLLGPKARLALQMRFRDQATRAQIAAALRMSENGAKNVMQRAKHKLRECIESKLQ
ncbi:MAG: RNA polymerase sigma factor [Pirellulaceae bacterium]